MLYRSARLPIAHVVSRCSELPLRSTVELGREENRGVLQDLVRTPQIAVLTLEGLQTGTLVGGGTDTSAVVDLVAEDPGPEDFRWHSNSFETSVKVAHSDG